MNFNGVFSQPSRFENGFWKPASDFMLPRDPQMKLTYLEVIAHMAINLDQTAIPQIYPCYPIYKKPKRVKARKHDVVFSKIEETQEI